MKQLFTSFSFLILLILLGGVWWNSASKPSSNDPTPVPFVIKQGANASSIAQNLEKEGFIRSAFAFRLYVQLTDKAKSIQAGDYRLGKNLTLAQLVKELIQGPIAVWITIPEGLRREEIAARLALGLALGSKEKEAFINEFLLLTKNQEGFLFPDTYLFMKTSTAAVAVERLKETFKKRVNQIIIEQADAQKLTLEEFVNLASIVERETKTEEERPIVAGILLKRLKSGWPLQADATLQYALANDKCQSASWWTNSKCDWWPKVKAEDKKINSRYNTYIRVGLPATPIANPGLSSIKAAANPQTSAYWFYLHDSKGVIHYAKTSQEHQENIRNYLQQ